MDFDTECYILETQFLALFVLPFFPSHLCLISFLFLSSILSLFLLFLSSLPLLSLLLVLDLSVLGCLDVVRQFLFRFKVVKWIIE